MKKQTKAVATKRPRTYKKSDLPRTARAYLGKTYSIYMDKENEAVARLIELHDETRNHLINATATRVEQADRARNAFGQSITVSSDHTKFNAENLEAILKDLQPKKPTLREQFLAWIGVKP